MSSADQVGRLLAMIPYLRAHDGATLSELARVFGVTPAQVRADLNVVWFCGLPGGLPGDLIDVDMEAVEGDGIVHLSNADYLERPLRLTPDEAMSLLLALAALREVAASAEYPAIDGAVAKIEAVAGPAGGRTQVRIAAGAERVREIVTAAAASRSRLQLEYDGVSRGLTTHPVVDPAQVSVRDGYAYLDAWAIERGAWRTYRIDRIVDATPTGEPAEDHGPAPARAGWLTGRQRTVTLRVAPGAAWVAEYYPTVSATTEPDGSVTLVLRVADPGWFMRFLLRLGGDLLAVGEGDARASREAATEALTAYQEAGLTGLG